MVAIKEKITKQMTVNDAIKLYPNTIGVFSKFRIDSCCGGAVSIEEASKRDRADLAALLEKLNEVAFGPH
ncbi:MAG: DUF542 domain-containing protein [Deltaproteobacteria bacterium]|nr:DUF542 domain-containing protein [Deltaproteobacteria bacterium]